MRWLTLLLFLAHGSVAWSQAIAPPLPPKEGPGSGQVAHSAVIKHRYGEGTLEYWIYEPDSPRPKSAPVIAFLHGWGGTNPSIYGAWIEHLVKRGNIVIYPRYQTDNRTPLDEFTPNTIKSLQQAFEKLKSEPGHVLPELDKFAVVGHSVGGLLTANVAALAKSSGLPPARALMSVQPGRTWNPLPQFSVPLEDCSKIPAESLLLTVVGDDDPLARDIDAKKIFHESTRVPLVNKNYVTLVSDDHGKPALKANHFAPTAPGLLFDNGEHSGTNHMESGGLLRERIRERMEERKQAKSETNEPFANLSGGTGFNVNALDYYGLWKLFDGLCDAAFYGKNREFALGNTPQQRFMGKWSDGTPVKELKITTDP